MSDTAQASLMDVWRPLAEKALKGEPLTRLDTETASGLQLGPLHAPATPHYLGRPYHGPWQVVARVDGSSPAAQALDDLHNGATALSLVFAGAPSAGRFGLAADTLDALDAALDGVQLDALPLRVEAGSRAVAAAALVAALIERRGTAPAALHAGLDPIGAFASTGIEPAWAEPTLLVDAVRTIAGLKIPGTILLADGRMAAEAGASPATELAFALHSMASILRRCDAGGLSSDEALPLISMALAADENKFATIAKFRAARRLHKMMADACEVDAPLVLHGETARRMLSYSDPQTNLLRLTVAAFSAGVGGADSVAVLPFDAEGSAFARRMARNIQNLLIEESHVGRLSDPGAGAGAVEAYTDALAETAWARFTMLEMEGDAVASGHLSEMVAADAKAAERRLQDKERVMIGVTIHPPQEPAPVPDEAPAAPPATNGSAAANFAQLQSAAADGAALADLAAAPGEHAATCTALTPARAAAPFGG